MNTRTVHLAAVTAKLLSAVLAVVATAMFCYFLLHPATSAPAHRYPAQLAPASTAPAAPEYRVSH